MILKFINPPDPFYHRRQPLPRPQDLGRRHIWGEWVGILLSTIGIIPSHCGPWPICLGSIHEQPLPIVLLCSIIYLTSATLIDTGGVQCFAIVSSSPVNNSVHLSFFYIQDPLPEVRLLGQRVHVFVILRDTVKLFSLRLNQSSCQPCMRILASPQPCQLSSSQTLGVFQYERWNYDITG